MDNDLKNKSIKIVEMGEKTTDKGIVVNIKDQDGVKFAFFDSKKDGGLTRAYEQYGQMGIKVGQEVDIAYAEVPASFVDDSGKTINFKRRYIRYFKEERQEEKPGLTKEETEEIPF